MKHKCTILIVDDEPIQCEIIEALLLNLGYDLIFADNGEEALARAVEVVPDLILLDVMIPGFDGFEVCQQLRHDPLLAEVPIILITALDDRESRLRGIEAGADDFLTKPIDQVELKARVKTIVRLNRYRRLLLERTYRQEAEQEITRCNNELALLNYVMTTAASTSSIHDLLYIACEALAQAFNLPQATALLLDMDLVHFSIEVEYLDSQLSLPHLYRPQQKDDLPEAIPIVGHLSAEDLLTRTAPRAICEGQIEPGLEPIHALMREHGVGTLLIVPILEKEQVAGMVELKTPERCEFNDYDLALAQSIAVAVGQAMQTARLHQRFQLKIDNLNRTIADQITLLQTERDRMQTILGVVGEAVMIIDLGGNIEYANKAALALLGYNEVEIKGQSWSLWQNEYQPADFLSQLEATLQSGQTWRGRLINKHREGSLFETALTVVPLFDMHRLGLLTGFVSIQRDASLFKEADMLWSD